MDKIVWIIKLICGTMNLVCRFLAYLIRLVHPTKCLLQVKLNCYCQYFHWILLVVCSIAHTCWATVSVAGCLGKVLGYCLSIQTRFMFLFYWQWHKVSTSGSKLWGGYGERVPCLYIAYGHKTVWECNIDYPYEHQNVN